MASREVRRAGHARGQLSRAERGVDTGGYFSRYVPQHHPAPGPSARCYSRGDRGCRPPVRPQGGIAALPVGHGGCSLRAGGAPRRRGDDRPVGIAPRAPNATQGRPAPTTLTGWFHLGLAHPPRRPSTFSNDEGPGRRKHRLTWAFTLERVRRIELPYSAWEADRRGCADQSVRTNTLVRSYFACHAVSLRHPGSHSVGSR